MPQPENIAGPSRRSTTARARSGGTIPLHRHWPGVRADRVGLALVAVEREGVVAQVLASRTPSSNRARSASASRLEPRGERRVAADAGRGRPSGASRRTRSPGPRRARSAARPRCRRGRGSRRSESFQPWLSSPRSDAPLVLDEAVAVAVAVPSIHSSAASAFGHSRSTSAQVAGPVERLAEQDQPQRRRSRRCRSTACAAARRSGPSRRSAARGGSCPARRRASRRPRSPASAARTRSVSTASCGRKATAWSAVMIASRPKSVVNHGTPAAT